MLKKIGILTFWNVPNYGSFLQSYALQKFVASLDRNYDVRQIAYLEKKHYDVYYGFFNICKYNFFLINPHFYWNLLKRIIFFRDRIVKIKQLKKFIRYYENYIPHTKKFSKSRLEAENFDEVILGSDIIWDYTIPFYNHDIYLFGNNFRTNKIIAYAPSFGTVKQGISVPEYVKTGLSRLANISVRDENSKKLVKEISGKDATVVCDPTFLWDFNNDKNIPECKHKKFIVIYGSEFPQEMINNARKYAETKRLKLICLDSLDDTFPWCDLNIKQDNMDPFQWVSFFKNADAVMTCTYHGLMFGLIFNKKIIFNPTQFIMDKTSSLIRYLDLQDVLVDKTSFADKINWSWNYTEINKKINILRNVSINFLKDSI